MNNSHKNVLRVTVETYLPFVKVVEDFKRPDGLGVTGPMAKLLVALSRTLNFTYTLERPPDGDWGTPNYEGNWSGMIGMLQRKEADLALGPFTLWDERKEVVHFSVPIANEYFTFLTGKNVDRRHIFDFLVVFTYKLWLLIFFCWIIQSVFHALVGRFWPSLELRRVTDAVARSLTTLFALFFKQAMPVNRGNNQGKRILLSAWMSAALVLTCGFAARLFVSLVEERPWLRLDTLKQLRRETKWNVMTQRDTALAYWITQKPEYERIWQRMQHHDNCSLISRADVYTEKFFRMLENDAFSALYTDDWTIKAALVQRYNETGGQCPLLVGKEARHKTTMSLITRKGLDRKFLTRLDAHVRFLLDTYVIQKDLDNEVSRAQLCQVYETRNTEVPTLPLDLDHLQGVFYVWSVGIAISLLVYWVEKFSCRKVVCHWRRRRDFCSSCRRGLDEESLPVSSSPEKEVWNRAYFVLPATYFIETISGLIEDDTTEDVELKEFCELSKCKLQLLENQSQTEEGLEIPPCTRTVRLPLVLEETLDDLETSSPGLDSKASEESADFSEGGFVSVLQEDYPVVHATLGQNYKAFEKV